MKIKVTMMDAGGEKWSEIEPLAEDENAFDKAEQVASKHPDAVDYGYMVMRESNAGEEK